MAKPPAELDLKTFGTVMRAKLDELGLGYRAASAITGVSIAQISRCAHGKPIAAGATYALAVLANLELEDFLPAETRDALRKVRAVWAAETVPPADKRETSGSRAAA
jgi:hypothetical protein